MTFLSTPSARRATACAAHRNDDCSISIHALREEGDFHLDVIRKSLFAFLSTPSARRATMQTSGHAAGTDNFYPRPPRGGRHIDTSRLPQTYTISIHALREEGDPGIGAKYFYDHIFLSTPSARRATHQRRKSIRATGNFYPRPPRGGRQLFVL